jgi:hypothetical protein
MALFRCPPFSYRPKANHKPVSYCRASYGGVPEFLGLAVVIRCMICGYVLLLLIGQCENTAYVTSAGSSLSSFLHSRS